MRNTNWASPVSYTHLDVYKRQTLGCGSFGKNSTTSNVSAMNLVNVKRIAKRRVNMQWFKIPPKIYFEYNSIQYLEKMPDISRAFIVTDETMVKLGNVDKLLYYLRRRPEYCHAEIFAEVEPDPSVETIMRGVDAMMHFKPDVIIALGGGSAMDAAKGMWLFYEHPDTDFEGLRQKFFDIRKRAYHFPKLGLKAKMVSIPTTSGTGSEAVSYTHLAPLQFDNAADKGIIKLGELCAFIMKRAARSSPASSSTSTIRCTCKRIWPARARCV